MLLFSIFIEFLFEVWLNDEGLLPLIDFYIRRKKELHQKLVMSKMNAKKAAKLDMDDRAKILQYFFHYHGLKIPFDFMTMNVIRSNVTIAKKICGAVF